MPCTYTESPEGDKIMGLQEALDQRERMLCAVCAHVELVFGGAAKNFLQVAADRADGLEERDITAWWKAHKAAEGRA